MKIVYVSDAVYPYNKGGKEKRLYELSTRLAAMGHDVHIYTMHWWKTPGAERLEDGVHLHSICKLYPLYNGDKRSIKEGIMFALACFKLFRVKFDVIDVDHMPFFPVFSTWIVCVLRGKKLHGTWHEALTTKDWTSYMGKSGYIAAVIERASIKLPYKITAASGQTKKIIATYHKRTKRMGLVASGIDTKLIASVEPAKAACDVLYIGRLVKDKNVDKLVDAFAIVAAKDPQAKCVIIGHGVEKANLQKQITELGLTKRIDLLAPLPEASEVYSYMKRAKVFVLPSVREGFGIVALEALACNAPVVTVDAPANAAKDLIVEDKNGSIVPLKAQDIATAILIWLDRSPTLHVADEMAQHDWDVLAKRQTEVYAL
ncbi:MAG TPA: glycosyltransferase family 4 protein [Patescibacteria group bacterium]|nr:glycosyltransferase family 4 protein [Patescibacteria group bacterium]